MSLQLHGERSDEIVLISEKVKSCLPFLEHSNMVLVEEKLLNLVVHEMP